MKLAEDLRRSVLQVAIEEKLTGGSHEGWRFVRLGDVVRVISGTSYEKHEVCGKGVQIIRGGNLVGEKIVLKDDDVFLPNEYTNKEKQVQQNDIVIIASTGSLKGIGRAAFADTNFDEPIQIGAFLRIIRPIDSSLADYLKIIFAGQYYRSHISSVVNGIGIKNIKEKHITELIIPLPPIDEQRRIVSRLDAILPLIAELEAAENELEILERRFPGEMRDSLLQAAIQGKLTGSNTDNWQFVRLDEVCYKITDGTHTTPKYKPNGIPFLSVKDISSGKINFDNTKYISEDEHAELYKRCNPEKGDILITKVGTTGIPAIVDTNIKFSLFVSVALLKFSHDVCDVRYLYFALMSPFVQEQARKNTRGVGNKN